MDQATVTNILLGAVGFLIVYTLNSIKTEIKEVKTAMISLSNELQKIDKRVVALEVHTKFDPSATPPGGV